MPIMFWIVAPLRIQYNAVYVGNGTCEF